MRCKPADSELSEAVALYHLSGDPARAIADMGWGVLQPSVLHDCVGLAALHLSRKHEAAAGAPQQHESEAAVAAPLPSAAVGSASLTTAEFARLVEVHLAVEHGDEAVLSVFRSLGGQPGGEGLVPAWRLVETCRFFDIPLDVHKMRELPPPAAEAAAAPAAAAAEQENPRVAAGVEQQQQLSFTQVYHLLAERRKLNRAGGGGGGFSAPRRGSLTSASSSVATAKRTPSAALVDSASVYAPPGPSEGFGVGLARYLTRGGASTPLVPRSFLRGVGGGGVGGRRGAAKQHRQRTLLCSASPASSVVCCAAAASDPSPPAAALPARLYRGGDRVVATETGEGYAVGERGHVVAGAATAATDDTAAGAAAVASSDGEGSGRAEGGGSEGYLRVAFRGREAFVPCAHLCLSGRDEGFHTAEEEEAAAAAAAVAGGSPTTPAAAAAASRIAAGDVVTIAHAGDGYAAGSVGAVVGHLVVLSPSSDRGGGDATPPAGGGAAPPPPPTYSGHQRVTRPTHLLVEVSGTGGGCTGGGCGPAMVPLEDVALLSRSEANRVLAADTASLAATASRAAAVAAATASGPSATAPGSGGGALSRLCEVAWRRCVETSCREGDAVALAAAAASPQLQPRQQRRPRPPPPRRHLVEAAPYLAKPCLSPPPPPQQARPRAGGGPPVRAVASLVHEVCQLKRQLCLVEQRSAEKADRIAALERDLQRQVFRGQQRVGSAGVGGSTGGASARTRVVHSASGGGRGCQPKQPQKQPALLEPCYPTAPPELPGNTRNPRAGVVPSPDLIGVD